MMDVCSMDVCSMCTVVKKAGSTLFMVLSTVACRGARYVRVVGPRGPVDRLGPTATVGAETPLPLPLPLPALWVRMVARGVPCASL